MTLRIYQGMEQRSLEWYAARCGIVTASVVGKLVTPTLKVANNETSRGITASLVAERITGIVEPTYTNDDMMRGVLHEPIARDAYSKHHQEVTECGFLRLEEDDWTLGVSPDGLVGDVGGIEVKCPRAKTHVLTILADEVPSYHLAQIQAALLATGREWWDFVSFCAGLPLFVKRVHPDQAWFDAIKAACQQFERIAAEMVASFDERAERMPPTERADYDELVI